MFDKLINHARGMSLWVLHYCTGCGAIEMPPTMTSRYDAERFGVAPAATPRQADVLLVTGYVAVKTLKRIIRSYEQMQDPKYVIGVGACTLAGGMYWDSYNTIKVLERYIPVDLYVDGCMPRPEALLTAFLELRRLIAEGKATGWKRYRENYKEYKRAQAELFDLTGWSIEDEYEPLVL